MRSGTSLPNLLIPVVDSIANPGLTRGGRARKQLRIVEMTSWQRVGSSCSGNQFPFFMIG